METFEKEIIEITDADKLEPKSILVKIYRIVVFEDSEKENLKELFKTIEYTPKRWKKRQKK